MTTCQNTFSIEEYRRILRFAKSAGYNVVTVKGFIELGCPPERTLVLRHDMDKTPQSLDRMLDAEIAEGVQSTVFIRYAGAEYNPMGYVCAGSMMKMLRHGFEVGLHTNCVEFANINGLNPRSVLHAELTALRAIAPVVGIAPHRDINYMYNTLPWLEESWQDLSAEFKLTYQSYEDRIMKSTIYVAETFSPHLCWRNDPCEAMATGRSVYMLTHSHWWYDRHAFEDQL